MMELKGICTTALLIAVALGVSTTSANATAGLWEVGFVNTLASPGDDLADGLGYISWDPTTKTMTSFNWDFLEGAEPGMAGNALTAAWLAAALGAGTNGSALWEVLTGEDAHPDVIDNIVATSATDGGLLTINGFPNGRAEFSATGLFTFVSTFGAGEETTVAQGSLTVRAVPEPAILGLMGIGAVGIGYKRRKKIKAA